MFCTKFIHSSEYQHSKKIGYPFFLIIFVIKSTMAWAHKRENRCGRKKLAQTQEFHREDMGPLTKAYEVCLYLQHSPHASIWRLSFCRLTHKGANWEFTRGSEREQSRKETRSALLAESPALWLALLLHVTPSPPCDSTVKFQYINHEKLKNNHFPPFFLIHFLLHLLYTIPRSPDCTVHTKFHLIPPQNHLGTLWFYFYLQIEFHHGEIFLASDWLAAFLRRRTEKQ